MSGGAMRWASACSTLADSGFAATEVADQLHDRLGGEPVDLLMAFFSGDHVAAATTVAETLKRQLAPGCLLAASAHGVIASDHELESGPALSAIAAHLPGVEARPFILTNDGWPEAVEDAAAFARAAPAVAEAELVVVLGDPFTLDVQRVLAAFNRHAPGARIVGGMASAGVRPGSNAFVLNDWASSEGGIAVALVGALRVDVVVSQGCRPVGPPLEVTRADGNVLIELDGRPALERAEQVLRGLPEHERDQLKNGLYVGRPVRAGAAGPGDYLIRNLLGADRERGFLAVGDHLPEREHIRLHVRDGAGAREDLEMLLSPQVFDIRPHAALLFSCNGRGRGLFGQPDRDIETLQGALGGSVPTAGMFCAGEIGPVGTRNFLHGHTASIAVVRSKV